MKKALAILLLAGCSGELETPPAMLEPLTPSTPETPSSPATPETPSAPQVPGTVFVPIADARAAVPKDKALAFAKAIAPMLVGRTLTLAEHTAIDEGGATALRTTLEAWVDSPAFADTARDWLSVKLKASGKKDALDATLPGNLISYLVKNKRPHAEVLTAETCRDAAGEAIACDTGAPFTAGVLTTRAYLQYTASRFNLKRARTTLLTFACSDYPLSQDLQPSLERARLIALFQNDKPPDGTSGAFGNGHACYTCHSQFGAHAQPFVKFDSTGRWRAEATGQQLEGGEQGRAADGLFASHLNDPAAAANEQSQYFGKPVKNLAEMAKVLSEHPLFLGCTVRSTAAYVLALSESEANALPAEVVKEVVAEAVQREPKPTLARLVVETFSHPSLIVAQRKAP